MRRKRCDMHATFGWDKTGKHFIDLRCKHRRGHDGPHYAASRHHEVTWWGDYHFHHYGKEPQT